MREVTLGHVSNRKGPPDRDSGIFRVDSCLRRRLIGRSMEVEHLAILCEGLEPVSKSARDGEGAVIVAAQPFAVPGE